MTRRVRQADDTYIISDRSTCILIRCMYVLLHDNTCVKLCALLCLRGSRSEASNSLNFITNLYSMDKYNIVDLFFTSTIIEVNCPISADMMSAGTINDVLCMRDQKNTNITSDELNQVLSFFCLDN